MALATQCPHCKTSFRVAQDQLKLRGGIVRCGACHEIFDANAGLVDLDAVAATQAEPAPPRSGDTHVAATEPDVDEAAGIEAWSAEEPVPADANEAVQVEEEAGHAFDAAPHIDEEAAHPVEAVAQADEDAAQAGEAVEHAGEDAAQADEAVEHAAEDAAQTAEAVEHAYEAAAQSAEAAEQGYEAAAQSPDAVEPVEPAVIDAAAAPEPEQARAESRPVFSMGSALLAEPGQEARPSARDGRIEPTLAPPADEELVATALPDHHDDTEADLHAQAERVARAAAEHEPLPVRESTDSAQFTAAPASPAKPARSRLTGRRSKLTPTKIPQPKLRVPEIDEPDFVKRGRQREENGKRFGIAMVVGSVLLALLLLAQAASIFRNDLAARFPAAKPALASLCVLMRCRVELPARIDNLTIETGELQTLGTDTYVLVTLLHNQGSLAQAWPDIELALLDANDKPLVRRVFAPADYLPQGVPAAAGFGAHAEQPVKLYFQLDQLKPSGYHIAVFYR